MVRTRVSFRRTLSHRSFSVILLVCILAISLRTLLHSYRSAPDLLFELILDVVPELDLASGPVVPGDLVESKFAVEQEYTPPQSRPPLGNHTLTPDGLLVVNPNGSHPVFQLIRDAEAAWEAKRARASRTLDEAVAEYRRRYRRAPPLGFDKWWDYVVRHRVQLPDEYDEIFEDIEPFWGIDPRELAHTQQELETRKDVVTVQKMDGKSRFEVVSSTLPQDRQKLQHLIENIIALLREVERDLPPLRLTFSPFDNPSMLSDWQIKSMALEAAANGTTLTRDDIPPVTGRGWTKACPPDSPAHLHPPEIPPPPTPPLPPSSPKTFIASHRATMDPCMNPSLLTLHGQFLSHKEGPVPERTLVPRFSLCATLLHHDIRPPIPYGWRFDSDSDPDEDEGDEDETGAFEEDVPWIRKTNVRLGWRGRTTGIHASPKSWWPHGHRARLVTLTNTLEGNVSLLPVPVDKRGSQAEASPVGEPQSVSLARANEAWMDIAFTDRPIACDEGSGTCAEMRRLWAFQEMQRRGEEGQYKFILDVDGNGWSGRFKRLMTSNALIFKATIYPEWYGSRIEPWVHYVPIQISYADLYDAVSFFRMNDALARRIARAGRAWSRRFWRREDMTAYLYRLLLEYARVSSLDRKAMDYVG